MANFLNAIIGEGKEKFIITNGSNDCINSYIRDMWASIMANYGIKNTYYVGRDCKTNLDTGPFTSNNFSEADRGLAIGGGIHCRTIEVTSETPEFTFQKEEANTSAQPKPDPVYFHDPVYFEEGLPKFFSEMLILRDSSAK